MENIIKENIKILLKKGAKFYYIKGHQREITATDTIEILSLRKPTYASASRYGLDYIEFGNKEFDEDNWCYADEELGKNFWVEAHIPKDTKYESLDFSKGDTLSFILGVNKTIERGRERENAKEV